MTLFRALDVALSMIEQETLPGVFERHAVLARAAREAVKAMGLERSAPRTRTQTSSRPCACPTA